MDTPTIRPIETRYAGCRFRSRLEARWAVFFDTLGVKWKYEPEGFIVGRGDPIHTKECSCDGFFLQCNCPWSPGTFYLPDFYLPEHGTWVEVRGDLSKPGLIKTIVDALDPWSGDNIPIPYNGTPDVYYCPTWCDKTYHDEWHNDSNRNHGTSYGILVLSDVPEPQPGISICHDFFYARKGVVREHVTFLSPRYPHTKDKIFPLLREVNWYQARGYSEGYDATTGDGYENDKLKSSYAYGDYRVQIIPTPSEVLKAYTAARSARFEHGEKG